MASNFIHDNHDDEDMSERHQQAGGQICSVLNSFNEIKDGITKIRQAENMIKRAVHRSRRTGTLGDSKDDIVDTLATTKKVIRNTEKVIAKCKEHRGDKVYRLQLYKLTTEMEEAVQEYEAVKKEANYKMREEVMMTTRSRPNYGETGGMDQNVQPSQLQVQAPVMDESNLDFLQDREQRIVQIESDLLDVNELFQQVASFVRSQGEMLDDIESNIETTNAQVESGCKQLEKALESKFPFASNDTKESSSTTEDADGSNVQPECATVDLSEDSNNDCNEETPLLGTENIREVKWWKTKFCLLFTWLVIIILVLAVILVILIWQKVIVW